MAVHNAQLKPATKDIAKNIRIAIVVAEFNETITEGLLEKNRAKFKEQGFTRIDVFYVPGAFEIPAMTSLVLDKGIYNVILTLGCVVRGSTPHFDYVCKSCTDGVTQLMTHYDTPVIFGVLTCDTMEQAEARVDDNYAIYALNYITQWATAENILETRYEELMRQTKELLQEQS